MNGNKFQPMRPQQPKPPVEQLSDDEIERIVGARPLPGYEKLPPFAPEFRYAQRPQLPPPPVDPREAERRARQAISDNTYDEVFGKTWEQFRELLGALAAGLVTGGALMVAGRPTEVVFFAMFAASFGVALVAGLRRVLSALHKLLTEQRISDRRSRFLANKIGEAISTNPTGKTAPKVDTSSRPASPNAGTAGFRTPGGRS